MSKKFLLYLSLLLALNCCIPLASSASHLSGGEISWECITSGSDKGKFIFTIKLYRDCQGLGSLTTPNIQNPFYSQGGPSTIPFSLISSTDLREPCYDTLLQLDCNVTGKNEYVFEERVYESSPIALVGTPPPGGAIFSFSRCCRPTLKNTSSVGYWLRSIMYPFVDPVTSLTLSVGTNSSPGCYDSSPEFADLPNFAQCAGSSINYLINAHDREQDSLVYEWSDPMVSDSASIIWDSLYSTTSPLPDTFFDSRNMAAKLDSSTGMITFRTYDQGQYVIAIKVSAYKCSQLVSEIYRDIPIEIISCAPTPTFPPIVNIPPIIEIASCLSCPSSSFPYNDTVQVGQSIDLVIKVRDVQFNLFPGLGQVVSLQALGYTMSDSLNSSAHCDLPPCAYIDSSGSSSSFTGSVSSGTFSTSLKFHWEPECHHMLERNGCLLVSRKYKTHYFTVKANDDFCPINGKQNGVFSITVIDTVNWQLGFDNIESIGGDLLIGWPKYSAVDFVSYNLFRYNTLLQNFGHIATFTDSNVTSYIDPTVDANSQAYGYLLQLNRNSNCTYDYTNLSIYLNAQQGAGHTAILNWNHPYLAQSIFNAGTYYIEHRDSMGVWSVIDSTTYGTESFLDSFPTQGQVHGYRVIAKDTYGFTGLSNIDTTYIDTAIVKGINRPGSAFAVDLYPNPGKGQYVLKIKTQSTTTVSYSIYSMSGHEIHHQKRLPISSTHTVKFNRYWIIRLML